jgi:diaminopropionate ammonia-lyase
MPERKDLVKMKAIDAYNFQYLLRKPGKTVVSNDFSEDVARSVELFHKQLPNYQPTNLVHLKQLSKEWGIKGIYVKDESTRFNLGAFKALGGSYAIAQLMYKTLGMSEDVMNFEYLVSDDVRRRVGRITFTTATDGNHGRGIAWAAQQLRQNAVIYMPKGSARSRIENIESHGADVYVTDLNYDDAVRLSNKAATENGWYIVQDTAWEGYTEIPLWIMQGYMTMCCEAIDQMQRQDVRPTHVFIQVGVGALAGAVVGYLLNRFADDPPVFITMEPHNAACIFASAASSDGSCHAVTGDLETVMAGLACGEPNPIGWNILRDSCTCYISCADYIAANGVRILANPIPGDARVTAGESGAVGIGVLDLICNADGLEDLRRDLVIGDDSVVLFFNTEGATDPVSYREIVWHGKYPSLI